MTALGEVEVATLATLSRVEARALASTEYERFVEQLRTLSAGDWGQPTACPGWDVRAVAGHSVGMLAAFTSLRSMMSGMRAATARAKRSGEPVVDAMTALQVAAHEHVSTSTLIEKAARDAPRAARWRARPHLLLGRMPVKQEIDGSVETWRVRYLLQTILTRDCWMHRMDIAEAVGRAPVLTGDHDGRIVADVVAEWARRHGRPFALTLTGPAGGRFVAGGRQDREQVEMDAVEFCRVLSGRGTGDGLLRQSVPF